MTRYVVAGLIVLGLAIGVWLLIPRPDTTPSTTVLASGTSTTTSPPVTTAPSTTTSSGPEGHVVTTVEQAEEILRDLWFGWFEGIYNQDEDRIREVVATERLVDAARDQFGVMEFTEAPFRNGVELSDTEILRSDAGCLAVWVRLSAESFLGPGGLSSGVDVLRWSPSGWRVVSSWVSRSDLWEVDCDASLS